MDFTSCDPKAKGTRLKALMERAERIRTQQPQEKNKLYALHAPEVECIGLMPCDWTPARSLVVRCGDIWRTTDCRFRTGSVRRFDYLTGTPGTVPTCLYKVLRLTPYCLATSVA